MIELVHDSGLKNWIKACIGLRYVRDAICPFIEKKCDDLYLSNETYTKLFCQLTTYSCTNCSINKLRPSHTGNICPTKGKSGKMKCGCQSSANSHICPNGGSCGVLYDLILNQHAKKAPRWGNSECSKWYKNGWEQMKCFIDIPGYNEKGHISQADITAFVHICQNNIKMNNQLRTEIDKLIQVRTDRNEIFHSGDMDITDDKLKEYLTHMRDVLQIAVFNKLPDIQTFLDKLTKLETDNSLEKDTTHEMIARKDALNALVEAYTYLQEESTNTSKDVQEINHQLARLKVFQDEHMKCITDHLKAIKCHMQSVKEEYNKSAEILLQHSIDLKNITSAIAQHTTCFENLQRELVQQTTILRGIETITIGIERIVTKNYRMISEIQPEIHTILLIIEQMYQISQDTAIISGKMAADINGISNKAELTHELVQRWNSIITKPEVDASDEIGNCLSAAKGELEKDGITINDVKDGSVEISFQCSIPTWIKICEKCMDGRMAILFGPLQDYLRIRHGVDHLEIAVEMYETDFVESVEEIVKRLHPKLISMLPNFAKSECYSDLTQMKLDDVLRVVLEHAKSREPSLKMTESIAFEDTETSSQSRNESSHLNRSVGKDVGEHGEEKQPQTKDHYLKISASLQPYHYGTTVFALMQNDIENLRNKTDSDSAQCRDSLWRKNNKIVRFNDSVRFYEAQIDRLTKEIQTIETNIRTLHREAARHDKEAADIKERATGIFGLINYVTGALGGGDTIDHTRQKANNKRELAKIETFNMEKNYWKETNIEQK